MSIVLDIIILLIIAFMALRSYKRGFVRTAIETVGFLAVMALCVPIAGEIASISYNSFIRPAIINSVEDTLTSYSENNADSSVNKVFDAVPNFIEKSVNVSKDDVKKKINVEIEKGAQSAAPIITDYIAKPIAVGLMTTIFTIILFAGGSILVKLGARVANKAFSFSFVKKINNFLGGIIGIPKGAIFAILFVWVVGFLIIFNSNGILGITGETIQKTYLFKFIDGFNPLI